MWARISEVLGDSRFLIARRAAQEPQEQEEGHHRRREVGQGDLPGAAVVPVSVLFDLSDNDGLGFAHAAWFCSAAASSVELSTALKPRNRSLSASNDGRSL